VVVGAKVILHTITTTLADAEELETELRDAIDDRIDETIEVTALLEKLIRHMMGEWFKAPEPAELEDLKYGVDELIECTLSTPECMPIWQQVTRNEVIEECAREMDWILREGGGTQGDVLRAMKKPIQTAHL
jgi:hypothetical protein